MKKLRLLGSACATAFYFFSISSHASMISEFSFHSDTTDCFSEIDQRCIDIFDNGLSGSFQVNLDVLDASGDGWIPWTDFLGFNATNSVSNWGLSNLTYGSVALSNWMVIDLVIDAFPDYSNGWEYDDPRGYGEFLKIGGLGIYKQFNPFSNASSEPGYYCPSNGSYGGLPCPVETVLVDTLGIQAYYTEPVVEAVPAPPALLLFGTGIIGLIGFSRRRKAA